MSKAEPPEGTTLRGALKLARQHVACIDAALARDDDPRQHETRAALALLDVVARRLGSPYEGRQESSQRTSINMPPKGASI